VEGFIIDRKTFLGLAMPNQCSQSKYLAGFGVIIWGKKPLVFKIPLFSTIVIVSVITMMMAGS